MSGSEVDRSATAVGCRSPSPAVAPVARGASAAGVAAIVSEFAAGLSTLDRALLFPPLLLPEDDPTWWVDGEAPPLRLRVVPAPCATPPLTSGELPPADPPLPVPFMPHRLVEVERSTMPSLSCLATTRLVQLPSTPELAVVMGLRSTRSLLRTGEMPCIAC